MSAPKPRRIYNPVGSKFASKKAVVQQHFAKDADINEIVGRAKRGIAPLNVRQGGAFADVSNMPRDLNEAFARVESAWELFEQLPAKAREELRNDPRQLVKANADFFIRHGLLKPKQKSPETLQGSPGGSGEGSPAAPSKKAPKAPKAPQTDEVGQE